MITGDPDRIEDDEVVAFVIEGVIGLAEAVFKELLAVERIVGRDAAGGVDAENVVIAYGVIDLQAEVLLYLTVKIEELESALFGDTESIKDMVAAIDGEIGFDGAGFIEGHIGADSGVELGLDVGIRDEEEGERLWGLRSEERGRSRSSEAGGSEESEKLPAGGHGLMISRNGYEVKKSRQGASSQRPRKRGQ